MTLRDFRIGWRLLLKDPAYSAVVTIGLALGFAACFLLLGYVHYCFSYDKDIPDSAQVYAMQHRVNIFPTPTWLEVMPLPARASALGSGMASQVSAVVTREVVVELEGRRQRVKATLVDPAFQAMFGLTALEGDLAKALARPDAIALTREQAIAWFGTASGILNRSVRIDGQPYRVTALLKDAPSNTTMPYRILAGTGSALWPAQQRSATLGAWQGLGGKVYVRLARHASPQALEAYLQDAFDRSPWGAIPGTEAAKAAGHVVDVRLRNVREAYFDIELASGLFHSERGDKRTVLGLGGVALLILALAATNYINLATVRTLRREREIGMRKVMGASAKSLVSLFVAESMLVALISASLGMLLAWLLLPLYSELVNRKLDALFTPASIGACLLLAIAAGLATGLYPSWIALRTRPGAVLAGRASTESRRVLWVRRSLSVIQFAIGIALTGITVAITWQTRFATNVDPGFATAALTVVSLPHDGGDARREALREALARLPGVQGVAATSSPLGASFVFRNGGMSMDALGRDVPVMLPLVSANFFSVYQIAPLHGRVFDPALDSAAPGHSVATVINLAAVRALGLDSAQAAVGSRIGPGGKMLVVGVVPDIRDQSLREAVQPALYQVDPRQDTLTLRSEADPERLAALAGPAWQRLYPDQPLELRRAASFYADSYAEDLRLAKLLSAASLLAIGLAAFGIYVLSAYNVQRRSREIVLRKLHGASRPAIARLLGMEFMALIGAGALIGLPVAAVVSERYLADFAERARMGIWPLAAALAFAILIALAATARHIVAAMRVAPAQALRD